MFLEMTPHIPLIIPTVFIGTRGVWMSETLSEIAFRTWNKSAISQKSVDELFAEILPMGETPLTSSTLVTTSFSLSLAFCFFLFSIVLAGESKSENPSDLNISCLLRTIPVSSSLRTDNGGVADLLLWRRDVTGDGEELSNPVRDKPGGSGGLWLEGTFLILNSVELALPT